MTTPQLRAESLDALRSIAHRYVRRVNRPVPSPELARVLFSSRESEDSVSPLLIRALLRHDRRFREPNKGTWELVSSEANATPLTEARFTVVDIEATGSNPDHDQIIEIAVVVIERGVIVEQMSTLVNPERRIPPWIRRLTGIDAAHVHDAPRFHQIAPSILRKLEGSVFVAHNIHFDYVFLRHHLAKVGYQPDPWQKLCTVKLTQKVFPDFGAYRLGYLSQRLGVGLEHHHRACDDALATARILLKVLGEGYLPPEVRTVGQLLTYLGPSAR